jgi:hypothetical protein
VASILPFIRLRSDFDDEATRIMGEAFDAACIEIRDTATLTLSHDVMIEVMAKRIIDAARKGERDPIRLRDIALAALGIGRPASDPAVGSQDQKLGITDVVRPTTRPETDD